MSGSAEDRERQQFALMANRLRGFRDGSVPLGKLLSDLEGLVGALEMTPDEWKERFRAERNALELEYAIALESGRQVPTVKDPTVAVAVDRLAVMVEDARTQLPFGPAELAGSLAIPNSDDPLSAGEFAILSDGLNDDVSFDSALLDLGIREAGTSRREEAPASDEIARAFASFERLIDRGLVKIGRIERVDGGPPGRPFGPVRHVDEPIQEVRQRVEQACVSAAEWQEWAFSCWLVTTDAGDAVARSASRT